MKMSSNDIDLVLMDERRLSFDRRIHALKSKFPLVDSEGLYIKMDRRHAPDRRLANIKVKEVAVESNIFDTLFSR